MPRGSIWRKPAWWSAAPGTSRSPHRCTMRDAGVAFAHRRRAAGDPRAARDAGLRARLGRSLSSTASAPCSRRTCRRASSAACPRPPASASPRPGSAGRCRPAASFPCTVATSCASCPTCTRAQKSCASPGTRRRRRASRRCWPSAGSPPRGCTCWRRSAARASGWRRRRGGDFALPPGDPLNILGIEVEADAGARDHPARRRPARTTGSRTTGRSPSARSAPRRSPRWRRAAASTFGTSVRAPDRWRSSGRCSIRRIGPRRSSCGRSGRRASPATRRSSACPRSRSSPATRPKR